MIKEVLAAFALVLLITGCAQETAKEPLPETGKEETIAEPEVVVVRENSLPNDTVKITPEMDVYPPKLHSEEFEKPVPVEAISSKGAEDSPFIPAGRDEMYFFFAADVRQPAHIQVRDIANGIYVSKHENNAWQKPERVLLQDAGKLALDGCEFVEGDEMLFCTAREGYTGIHWFSAKYKEGKWQDWENADFRTEYEVGELHIHENELYYHSSKAGSKGGTDIWRLTKVNGEWQNPENIAVVNTPENEGMPYITPDGNELWFHRWYMGTPAVFRSNKAGGKWQEPEMIVSQFAGEPTMDKDGNLYFVHHYYKDSVMLEADIYVAEKK
ncbi:MAG TPA: hypothetical protein HA362_08010 [Nanoarchaeota archaeon]|nr:hypothetical protein [Nanoarchaeota archaeon]